MSCDHSPTSNKAPWTLLYYYYWLDFIIDNVFT